jgi:hypothetical protein
MIKPAMTAAAAAPLLLWSVPAFAGRSAIDENEDGGRISASFAGYCDYNGEDCGGGFILPYKVSIGSADFTDVVTVHGNGLLTFGAPVDFDENPAVREQIDFGIAPALTEYARTLVSAGQSVTLDDDESVFLQSARLGYNAANGAIVATWFTCYRPTGPNMCPESNLFTLTLTPRRGGFAGHFDFGTDQPENGDRGYVSGGVFTATGNDFFLPAIIDGSSPSVPEPASWALMIAGFSATGVALRRRNARITVAHAKW